jgi:ATP-dependent DNA helicase RecG
MDIEKFLKSGETESIEFKESFDKETIETVAAFSNTRGGIIFIGVNNDGDARGASIGKETLKDWGNRISQNTEPSLFLKSMWKM